MRNNIHLFCYQLLALLIVSFGNSQERVKVQGVVVDTLGQPIELANVMFYKKGETKVSAFALTNPMGKFELTVLKDIDYNMKVSFLGYKEYEKTIRFTQKEPAPLVAILNKGIELDQVEIVTEVPIRIKEDTISYKTDYFKDS